MLKETQVPMSGTPHQNYMYRLKPNKCFKINIAPGKCMRCSIGLVLFAMQGKANFAWSILSWKIVKTWDDMLIDKCLQA